MNVENTSLPESILDNSELTLVTVPKKAVFKNAKKDRVTKKMKRKKQEPFRCPLCLRVARKISMKTCEVCKSVGMQITDFCKFCARLHDIVGSPYTHKANYVTTYPNEVFQL